jgi:hypothetical protein
VGLVDAAGELECAVEDAGGVVAGDDDGVAEAAQEEGFFGVGPEVGDLFVEGFEEGVVALGEEDALVAGEVGDGELEAVGGELLAGGGVGGELEVRGGEGREGKGEEERELCGGDFYGLGQEGIPQGLRPRIFPVVERPPRLKLGGLDADKLVSLERVKAKSYKTKATAKTTTKYRGSSLRSE